MGKNRRREKKKALYISISIYPYLLQRMQGDINREVFPTFLAKKSYDWWITRRRMEIYTKISKRKDLKWSRQKHGKIRTTHGVCEFRTPFARMRGCASFAHRSHSWGGVRVSHTIRTAEGVCEFRTSLEQFSSEGHIFLVSAPNRTRFEALDSWLPELWNGIYHVENGLREVLQKCQRRLQLLSSVFLFASFCFSLLFFAFLLLLACFGVAKSLL